MIKGANSSRQPLPQAVTAHQPLHDLEKGAIVILSDIAGGPRHIRALTLEPFHELRLRLVAGALGGPGSAHPTQGCIQTRILASKRLQLLFLLLPIRSGLRIFQRLSVHQVLSLRGVHPLADKLGHLLFTTLVLPGTERPIPFPLCSPLLLLSLASGPFRPFAAMGERDLGLPRPCNRKRR